MDYQKIIQGWDDRATCCVLVSLIQYAEDEIGKSTAEATDTILRIESCITKIAELIALGKLDLEVGFLKYYLLRVSHFSVRFNEALQSRQGAPGFFAKAKMGSIRF